MSGTYLFMIVGANDNPVYELEYTPPGLQKKEVWGLSQFILHSALDIVDEQIWTTNQMYLKVVDKFENLLVSAYVTAANMRFLLLHESKNEDGIKNFFHDAHELYLKVLMNPFHDIDAPILSPTFDARVKALARKYL
eukprot:TRINITY_DN2701_c0_g2::TRINITY_DN2701_c0_g2_i1::g.25927::m.25927 TRINITY_DN2701_c0_g2::TRINITY_DN2701_c0_g2_i1::g.25927  ORF type:complete len:137 (+),score=11.94,sp/Q08CN0/TPPC2_DANRE/53.62/1e-49,Sedlin_N/PF04628.8/1e-43,Sybindin/PF04099.7/8.4e+03,Sybindin/PF04099.7/2.5e-06,Endotoxin_N/PF03945.9/0.013 TRINITY_DN2701_c0_g2_i1:75-485(+)